MVKLSDFETSKINLKSKF